MNAMGTWKCKGRTRIHLVRKNAMGGQGCHEMKGMRWRHKNTMGARECNRSLRRRLAYEGCALHVIVCLSIISSSLPFQTPESRKWVGYALLTHKNIYWYLALQWTTTLHPQVHQKTQLRSQPRSQCFTTHFKGEESTGEKQVTHSTNLAKHDVYNLRTQMFFFYELLWT